MSSPAVTTPSETIARLDAGNEILQLRLDLARAEAERDAALTALARLSKKADELSARIACLSLFAWALSSAPPNQLSPTTTRLN